MDWIINNIQLTWKLVWLLRTYKACNLRVRFLKREFYIKLFDVILLRVTLSVLELNGLKDRFLN